jgi:DNA repair exonuclease SbcCD ATPase subunit
MTPRPQTAELEQISSDLTTIRDRRAELHAELGSMTAQETALNERAATLQAEIRQHERDPQDRDRLARLTAELDMKLSKADSRSPTIQATRRTALERLSDESRPVADRLELVVALIRDVGDYHRLDKSLWTSLEGAARKRDL